MAFPARLGLLPTLAGFIDCPPLQEDNLSLPKAVQKPQVTTAPACGFLPYLWLSVGAWKDGSESENTPGSTGAVFLALWQLADVCYENIHQHPQLHGSQKDVPPHPEGKDWF